MTSIKRPLLTVLSLFVFALGVAGQAGETAAEPDTPKETTSVEKPKRIAFRATAEQITEAQSKLKTAGSYKGVADGKMNDDLRTAVKSFQEANGLRRSGALNRATLEKMGIALTDAQKEIPIPESSYVKPKTEKPAATSVSASAAGTTATGADAEKPKRGPVFRATKDQINEAQRKLKAGGMYAGEETGTLTDETRAGLKKFQEASGLKVTGTLNAVTLEKMGIELTDRQKAISAEPKQ